MAPAKTGRNEKIVSLYYAGYSRRAIGEAFNLSMARVTQILERHAVANGLIWPPIVIGPGIGSRYDHPNRYKPIPPEELDLMQVDLTDDELNAFTIMAGYAMGAATKSGEEQLARSFLRVANAVHRNNPRWRRYQIEDEPEPIPGLAAQ